MPRSSKSRRGARRAAAPSFAVLAARLADVGREFYRRGWALGTSGNFSAVLSREPLRLAITATGLDKSTLTPKQILALDGEGKLVRGASQPSAEAAIHLAVVRSSRAGAVLHTHSIWSTMLSEAHASAGGLGIAGFEMLKGLRGVASHEHCEWLPVLENSQDIAALAAMVENTLKRYPDSHGFLIRRHGLYTWGEDLAEAKRHVEILEFLLEVVGRETGLKAPAQLERASAAGSRGR